MDANNSKCYASLWRHSSWSIVAFSLIFCLTATAFLAQNKFDFISYVVKSTSTPTNHPWQDSAVWRNLTGARRSPLNQCSVSSCPAGGNRSRLDYIPSHSDEACPFYFRYIHEDLAPWAAPISQADPNATTLDKDNFVGISKDMLDRARDKADFRLVIKNGRVYVHAYRACFQTRSIFTIWGILQLLRLYPGLVPDVDMLFGCGDTPRVSKSAYTHETPPPVFRYCSTANHWDIPFPDWSFWGWPEVDLGPWDKELYGILGGENELLWEERDPTAFWKGNTGTGGRVRQALHGCNGPRYEAVIIHQNWNDAIRSHFKGSRLSHQCRNRYKIYAEGNGWSVSLKYIMGCDSPTLVINPVFYDFFSRGLLPLENIWPISVDKICDSIKFAVDWGNNHTIEAEALGRAGRQYITKDVSMKHVYEYMLHMLREYARLLRFEPTQDDDMTELCVDSFLCQAPEKEKVLYEESTVKGASAERPCAMPPRDQGLMESWTQHKMNITHKIQQAQVDGSAIDTAISKFNHH